MMDRSRIGDTYEMGSTSMDCGHNRRFALLKAVQPSIYAAKLPHSTPETSPFPDALQLFASAHHPKPNNPAQAFAGTLHIVQFLVGSLVHGAGASD